MACRCPMRSPGSWAPPRALPAIPPHRRHARSLAGPQDGGGAAAAMVAAADGSLTGQTPQGDTLRVREVWQDNLEAEMKVGAGRLGSSNAQSAGFKAVQPLSRQLCGNRCAAWSFATCSQL